MPAGQVMADLHTDKENLVKINEKYLFRNITSLKQLESGIGSVPNNRIHIQVKVKAGYGSVSKWLGSAILVG
jgi:hypothetical protein